jgi:Ca-activated chloride channel family protein
MMLPDVSGLHFAQPAWFWGLLLPLLVWGWLRWRKARNEARLARYADAYLLPRLILEEGATLMAARSFVLWSLLWLLGMVAMAGPRFGYTDVQRSRPGTSLLILLDLSRSMAATDVKPSRLARAQQEISDLISANPGFRIGLIAFASVPHVVAPITDDDETLRHLLPSLSTDLVRLQGSRLGAALNRAERLLASEPKEAARALILVSDGDFGEARPTASVVRLRRAGGRLHVLGVGTPAGAPVPAAREGQWVHGADGEVVVSRLSEQRLQALAAAGGGLYRRADFQRSDTDALVAAIAAHTARRLKMEGGYRVWHERYYVPVGMMLGIWLYAYLRGR